MAVITRSVGSFNKTSKHGETAYGTVVSFNMPAFVSITEVKATFTTLGGGGDTQDRAFIINGTRAHAGNVWATSGINLNVGLVVAGNNTFRVTLKSQPDGMDYGTMCTWNISNITLTITYTEPISNPGTISLNKASMDAGETVVISMTAADVGVTRTIEVFFGSEVVAMSTVVSGAGAGANTYDYTFPLASCTKMPNSTSGTIKVKMTGSVGSPVEKTMTINVPASVVPTMTSITAARQANGVDGSIAEYVQKYSGVTLTINGAAGAHGSTISKYEIIGGGFSANASQATFSPLPNDGETVFIGKITDSRGRTATKSVSIIVRPYSNPTLTDPSAFRSDDQGVIADAGEYVALKAKIVFSSINGKNTAGIEGRVFEKGTAPPSWESMTDDTTEVLGGALAINKIYTAQIKVEDKISSYIHNIEIGTAVIGMNILPGAAGASFGEYAVPGLFKTPWPAIAPACPRVGDIIMSAVNNSPALTWPGTVWTALGGRFLIGADATYTAGSVGGAATHTHSHYLKYGSDANAYYLSYDNAPKTRTISTASRIIAASPTSTQTVRQDATYEETIPTLPPYLAVYMWKRTA